ncbi:MAG TPA: ABC transporter ATP-binding protein [Gemmatimonadaceae bacterium]|nr:ABC transporter ATP-binding protein [Gemmatimonadaceae bacterium]
MTTSVIAPGRRRPPRATGEKPSRRERLAALRYLPKLFQLVWSTNARYTTAMMLLRIIRAFQPLAVLWIGKLIIDAVVRAVATGVPDYPQLWRYVGLELAIVVAGELLARASALIESLLGDLFTNRISVRIMEHAATLDLHQFEDPAFYDHLERARRGTVGRLGLLTQMLQMAQDALTLISLTGALLVQGPWLLVLLVAAVVPSFIGETHFASLAYSLLFRWTPQRRELDYLRYVGASDRTAKEVQMFGLAAWLAERYGALADSYYEANKRLSIRKGLVSAGLSILGTLGYYAAYVVIIVRAVRGTITIGTLTFLAGAFSRSRDLIQRLLLSASGIYEESLYLRDLFVFFEMQPTIRSQPNARAVARPIRQGFVFEDVGFRYPESVRWAVRHVSFALRPGERIALVGENGAGKTTLTKLLARLYDPSEGRILLDGVDLREYALAEVRQAIGVIFQDFVRYDMRFDENVGVGEIERVREYLAAQRALALGSMSLNGSTAPAAAAANGVAAEVPHTILTAAEKSLAATLLPRFPLGYQQMLGRRFEEGVDLSGGEWQKVALARAYMRDAQVLILDEPTAALDARAEYDVFVRFNELMAGRMAVVISHRFSTVRMADRIVVLRNGEVEESGTHAALVQRGGLYAELFQMQAAGYR